jgi:glycosyltransferase involved in cell wall biosynthesis
MVLVSVLIRNLNEANELNVCLKALQSQQVNFAFEILVVDNESDDNSVEIAKSFGCRVAILPRKEFTYGKALNFGIERCNGKFILILSAHVFLLSDNFLQKAVAHFDDEKIAGLKFVTADNPAKTMHAFLHKPAILSYEEDDLDIKKIWLYGTVNSCALIRKSVWQQIKYDETTFYSEDKIWAYQVLKAGYKIKANIPLFYLYHKKLTQKQILDRRAKEEVSFMLTTGLPSKQYQTGLKGMKGDVKQLFNQTKGFAKRTRDYFKIKLLIKKIVEDQKDQFKLD